MSIKKAIALTFLLLANVFMLAKPVVCYYRHTNQIPVTTCAANQKKDCNHAKQQNCPNTKKGCDTQKCVLKNLFLSENNDKLPKPIIIDFNIITGNISDCQTIKITDLTSLPFRKKPYVPLIYADFTSQSFGLRAPPAC